MIQNWQEYHSQTKNRPPSPLLIKALAFVQNKGMALDLGCGAFRDSKYLLSEGFKKVIAVDKESIPEDLFSNLPKDNFEFICSAFHEFKFPVKEYNLVNAQYSLPFNFTETFGIVWGGIEKSLVHAGIFAGQFFGIRDQWNTSKSDMTFHTKVQVEDLLSNMQILELREEERDGFLVNGEKKHWHVFHVIAKMK